MENLAVGRTAVGCIAGLDVWRAITTKILIHVKIELQTPEP